MTDRESDDQIDANIAYRDAVSRRLCSLMGWEYRMRHVWTALRAAATGKAAVISCERLEQICKKLEGGER